MSIVTRLGIKEMKAMKDAMFKAEGNINLKSRCCFFSQDSNNLGVRDAFQFLSQMLGEPLNLNKRGGYIKKHKFLKLHNTISYSWYSGKVWCPVTENGTWFARRNGKIIPTGNTRNNIPFQLEQMVKQPGKYAAVGKAFRSLQGGTAEERKESELLPSYMKEGIPIRLGSTGQNKANYLYSLGLPIEDVNNISARKLLGMMAPPIKFPLERMTKQSFYLGKPIKEVDTAPPI